MKTLVLVFCRNYLVADFKLALDQLPANYEFHFLTDGASPGIRDTVTRFYARLKTAPPISGWTAAEEAEAINRCRLLRELPILKAKQMLRAMASVMEEELEYVKPTFVYGQMVDEYVTYILAELARKRGIAYVGNCGSYFPGRVQLTRFWNGLPHNFRHISSDEAETTLNDIQQRTFRQNYGQPITYTRFDHVRSMLRYQLKRVVFAYKGWRSQDPLNIHFACLPYVVERRHWRDFPSTEAFDQDWEAKLQDLKTRTGKPVIYHPLAYYPESTINYWVGNMRMLDYENTVLEICRTLAKDFILVVKEHGHMVGARRPAFYAALGAIPNLVSVPAHAYSNDVLAQVEAVVIGGGSIGVEATVRNLPVLTFCDTTYWYAPSEATFLNLNSIADWPLQVSNLLQSKRRVVSSTHNVFVAMCLASTMRSSRKGKVWPIPDAEDITALFSSCVPKAETA